MQVPNPQREAAKETDVNIAIRQGLPPQCHLTAMIMHFLFQAMPI